MMRLSAEAVEDGGHQQDIFVTRAATTISEEVDIEGMGAEGRGTIMSMKMWRRRRRRRRRRRKLTTDDMRENHTSQ
jgi:hypothetical protein